MILGKALDWLRAAGKEVRNMRLAPFAVTSAKVWELLRQESNVELGPITRALEKTVALPQTARAVAVAGLCRGCSRSGQWYEPKALGRGSVVSAIDYRENWNYVCARRSQPGSAGLGPAALWRATR
jgi:hypothetical protein